MSDPTYLSLTIGLTEYFSRVKKQKNDPALRGLPLPLPTLTAALRNLRIGEVTILGGYEGHGKSALAQQIAFSLGGVFSADDRMGKPRGVYYVSLEMSSDTLIARGLAQFCGCDYNQLLAPELLSATELLGVERASRDVADWPIVISDEARASTSSIAQHLRNLNTEYDIKLVVVDYLQLLADDIPIGGQKVDQMDNIIRDLKDCARRFKCHLLVLSSLNRAGDDLLPNNMNLRGSQGLAYGADTTMFLTQPYMINQGLGEKWQHHAVLNIQKQRNGPSGMYYLKWDAKSLSFQDVEADTIERHLKGLPMKRMYS